MAAIDTQDPCYWWQKEAADAKAENAELKVLLGKVLLAHPHIEPKPGCGICQALDEHESLKWGE